MHLLSHSRYIPSTWTPAMRWSVQATRSQLTRTIISPSLLFIRVAVTPVFLLNQRVFKITILRSRMSSRSISLLWYLPVKIPFLTNRFPKLLLICAFQPPPLRSRQHAFTTTIEYLKGIRERHAPKTPLLLLTLWPKSWIGVFFPSKSKEQPSRSMEESMNWKIISMFAFPVLNILLTVDLLYNESCMPREYRNPSFTHLWTSRVEFLSLMLSRISSRTRHKIILSTKSLVDQAQIHLLLPVSHLPSRVKWKKYQKKLPN